MVRPFFFWGPKGGGMLCFVNVQIENPVCMYVCIVLLTVPELN